MRPVIALVEDNPDNRLLARGPRFRLTAELVRDKRIEGISELRDESDKDGMRIVIELRKGEVADVVLNNLYKQTPMQSVFGINMVALHEGQPKLLNLKQVLEAFLSHRREVVTRRTIFDLRKARDRAHVLEGQTVALANIDEVIALIKASAAPAEAKTGLMERAWEPGEVTGMLERAGDTDTRPDGLADDSGLADGKYRLSAVQAQAILDLRLHRLTGLEQDKIINEYKTILDKIKELSDILSDPELLLNAPHATPVGRLDEARAARQPCWRRCGPGSGPRTCSCSRASSSPRKWGKRPA